MSNPAASPRRVAVASAVGATIEWYDFFLYGTAAGLVFDKLFFNGLDGPVVQFAAFGTFGSASSPARPGWCSRATARCGWWPRTTSSSR